MPTPIRWLLTAGVLLSCSFPVAMDAGQQQGSKAFARTWEGRRVVLARPLYSVTYDERRRLLPLKHHGRVTAITVATPSETLYRFDSKRESESDIVERSPERLVNILRQQYYRSTHLDIGNVQEIENAMLVRYEPGVALVVKKVQIERTLVRLTLQKEDSSDVATGLTVKWPAELSTELTEAPLLHDIINRYLH